MIRKYRLIINQSEIGMRFVKLFIGSCLLFSLVFVVNFPLLASTYYVSPTGDDADDGMSEGTAWQDLATAIYGMTLGDTLIVLPGSYDLAGFRAWPNDPWKGKMYLGGSGGDANNITTIRGKDGAARPEINVYEEDGTTEGGKFQFNGVVGLHLEYLQINHGSVGYGSHITYKDIIFQGPNNDYGVHAEHHNSTIEDCQFYDIYGGGDAIGIYITGDNNTIRSSFFKNINHHAINSNTWGGNPSKGWVIEGNRITNVGGHGVGLQNLQDTIIRNNVIVNAGSQALSLGGSAYPNSDVKIVGNTIYSAPGVGNYGLYSYNLMNGLVFENNIVVHKNPIAFSNGDIMLKENMETYSFRNNLYLAPGKNSIFMPSNSQTHRYYLTDWQEYTATILEDGIGLESGSVNIEPGLVNVPILVTDSMNYDGSGVDLHLNIDSPAKDAGVNTAYLFNDIDKNWRPQGSLMDIGAYELEQSTGDTEAPTVPGSLSSVTPTDGTVYNPLYNIARLSWNASTDNIYVVGYKIYRDSVYVATVGGATAYDDTGLTAETSYNYHVTAIDAEGNESAASNTVAHTVPEAPPLNEPPEAKFTFTFSELDNSVAATFAAYTSQSAEGSLIKRLEWDFGDGTTETVDIDMTGVDPEVDVQPTIPGTSHTYAVKGYFPVKLTVTDTRDRTGSVTWNLRYRYADPVTYYVSPTGDDLNDGLSEAEPLKDLKNAMYRLYNGCTLIVLEGSYDLHDFKAWPNDPWKGKMYLDGNGGSTTEPVRIKGKEGAFPKIVAYKQGVAGGMIEFKGIVGLELSNLSIHGEVGYGTHLNFHDLEIMGPGNAYGFHGHFGDSTIENCYIHDIRGGGDAHGIYVTGSNITIRGNFFEAIGISAIHSNSLSDYLIEDNYITNVGGHGISIFNSHNSIIRNNVLVNISGQALSIGGGTYASSNNKFIGNTVYNAESYGWAGVFISNDSTNLIFQNNIIAHSKPFGFTSSRAPTSAIVSTWTFSNNLYYNYDNYTWTHFVDGGDRWSLSEWQAYTNTTLGVANIDQDSIQNSPDVITPPSSSNDHLTPAWTSAINLMPSVSSPAVDAGIEIVDLADDINGVDRSMSTDIGAYQQTGSEIIKPLFRAKDEGELFYMLSPDIKSIKYE